ncbi:unnamed protein product [Darwinula stevensoni]|uniref:Uncharacterized protein n=1 Tax=Darwinula stevensoni TaxID=69355 RepID=A0A7R8XBY3_9CRUS|nr:unnamed protein product [Darwinula stevensoni]CAG0887122.1 unnamed protein product [Darwinula stevensoni]
MWSRKTSCCRKYVVLCVSCGVASVILAGLYVAVHLVLRAHTHSLHYFETVPSYVPAAVVRPPASLCVR